MTGVRQRVRAELTAEIKQLAHAQIAADGAASLSLRAVARDLGMASSAIYRYFPSRDQLLTALIIDSYDSLGEAVEAADATCRRNRYLDRWLAAARAARKWAADHPSDYGLIFGTPVPGYAAPVDTIGPASRYVNVLSRLLVDLHVEGRQPPGLPPISRALHRDYANLRAGGMATSDELLLTGLTAWATVFGFISFELFGHLHNVLGQPGLHFETMITMVGIAIVGEPSTNP